MSVKIRLKRMGAMKRPFYRIVVADSRSPRDGRFIEILGYYNPCVEPSELKIDGEKAKLWLGRGAQPTDTAGALLKREGLLERSAARRTSPKSANGNAGKPEAASTSKKNSEAAPAVEAAAPAAETEPEQTVAPVASAEAETAEPAAA